MYESLKDQSNDFHLYIFAFDDLTYKILQKSQIRLCYSYFTWMNLKQPS